MTQPRRKKWVQWGMAAQEIVFYHGPSEMLKCRHPDCVWGPGRINHSMVCEHRTEWMRDPNRVKSMLAWAVSHNDGLDTSSARKLRVSAADELIMLVLDLGVVTRGNEKFITVTHDNPHEGAVMSMVLNVDDGDSLYSGYRAAIDYYRAQPEHQGVIGAVESWSTYGRPEVPDLPCATHRGHGTRYAEELRRVVNISIKPKVLSEAAEILALASSFIRLNSVAPPPNGLCLICHRLMEKDKEARDQPVSLVYDTDYSGTVSHDEYKLLAERMQQAAFPAMRNDMERVRRMLY